ncbi:hypothetical protein EU528_12775 [Candidatus Thorarchaeota archaeon]|nr:MAG: hypothetical protein EU528_12775 [Candidatus Thorarchaeota archaeon]
MSEVDKLKQVVGKRVVVWGVISLVIGIVLLFSFQLTLLGGIGVQAIIWGLIDALIGASIMFKQKEQSIEKISQTVSKSIKFDILVLIVGIIVIIVYLQDPYMMGNGIGVVIQGFFLLVLDNIYHKTLMNL